MPPLTWAAAEPDGGTVVSISGDLDLPGAANLRTGLLKCLAEQPAALLVDLSSMSVADRTALSVFTAVVRQAALWPGVPVLLCAATPGTGELLAGGGFGRLPLYATVAAGRREVERGTAVIPTLSDQLLPLAGAARHARNLATEACTRWSLPHLVGSASLMASELVTNAVQHAGTLITLQLTRRPRYVHVAVRDGSTVAPRLAMPRVGAPGGRGLLLVDSVSVRWGSMPSRDGKVVWATLAADN